MRTTLKGPATEPKTDRTLPALDGEFDLDDQTEINPAPERDHWVEPIEPAPALPGPRQPQALPVANMPALVAAKSPEVASRQPLPDIWPEPPRTRRLPNRLRLALAGVPVLLVGIIAFGSSSTKLETPAAAPLNDDMVVSAEDLKNRREVRADDFRPRGAVQPVLSPAPGSAPVPETTTAEALAERRARRQNDPEDVLALRTRRGSAKAGRAPSSTEQPLYEGPVYVTAGAAAGGEENLGSSAHSTRPTDSGPHERLVAAGTSVPAMLISPLELRGDSATVIVKANGQTGLLRGARFIGTASAGTGRVTIRFREVVLADGRQAHVDGEAQDEDGSFGFSPNADSAAPDSDRGSVLGEVAQETATDVVSAAIGIDVASRAVDRYVSGSRARRGGGAVRTVALPAGTKLQVFLHEAVTLGR